MAYKDETFYLFFSAFFRERGRERSHVVGVTTLDWKVFSEPFLFMDGRDDGWTGMCSPNITRVNATYYLTFNSWGDVHPNGQKNQLFYCESEDLGHWTSYRQIGQDLTHDIRCIDIAITFYDDQFYVMWKDESIRQPIKKYKTRIASCPLLTEPWNFIGDGYAHFFLHGGKESSLTHENYEFIEIEGKQMLLSLDYSPHHPVLYSIGGASEIEASWQTWIDGRDLMLPREQFNTNHIANAPFLADWRENDGYFYLLYAGRTHGLTHAGRGNNKLGLARSRDLTTWNVPGIA